MIVGIGIDIADIDYFSQLLRDPKTSAIKETFTEQEINTAYQGATETSHRLAARFAAKEAYFKALSSTMLLRSSSKLSIQPKEVEVRLDNNGCPYLQLSQALQQKARQWGVKKSFLSLSHEKNMAIAFVVLEG